MEINKEKSYYGYFLIAVSVLILYIASIGISRRFNEDFLPAGDAFTYTLNFFMLLDRCHTHFWSPIFKILSGHGNGWYWLIQLSTAIISPILFKEPYSIALVNFVLFGFATVSIFRLGRYLKFSLTISFLLAVVFWLYPCHYGYSSPVSLLMMQLDTAFLAILIIAVANMIIFTMDTDKVKNAILAGFTAGLAVWGRGNSLPYVLIVVCAPLIIIIWKLRKAKDKSKTRNIFCNLIVFFALAIVMGGWFYICNWPALMQYYTHVPDAIALSKIQIKTVVSNLITYPGMFFSRCICELPRPNPAETALVTLILHGLILLSLYVTFRRNKNIDTYWRSALKIIAVTGAVAYYGIYFFNTILFNASILMTPPCVYSPMLTGLVFGGFSLIASFTLAGKIKIHIKEHMMIPAAIGFLAIYGIYFTKKQTPLNPAPNLVTPREVERFAVSYLDNLLDGGTLGVLWYGHYNTAILNYYRVKNDLPNIRCYANEYHSDLWSWYYSPDNIEKIRAGIRKTFEEADFVIIPEYLDSYSLAGYALFRRGEDVADYLNSPESPRFVVRMVLHDIQNIRLLLLQRSKGETTSEFVPLKLPFGPSCTSETQDYYSNVSSDRINRGDETENTVSSSLPQTEYGKQYALDGNSTTFWEQGGLCPFLLQMNNDSARIITKYTLQAGPAWHGGNYRMPAGWILKGSNNGIDWIDLDTRSNETNWKDLEERSFDIVRPVTWKFYRLYFTAVGEPGIIRLYDVRLLE